MGCRVGITTDVERRRSEWEVEYPGMTDWKEVESGLTREEAEDLEKMLKTALGCDGHHGGDEPDDPNATWTVYTFKFPD